MLNIHGIWVIVSENLHDNRERLRVAGEELRLRVHERRMQGLDDNSTDREAMVLLLGFIAHDRVYGERESIEERKKILYNIARTATLLYSKKASAGEEGNVKERYVSHEERSIWRDVEFLHKMIIPEGEVNHENNYHISDYRVRKIFEHDVAILAEIIACELNPNMEYAQRRATGERYQDTSELLHTYEISNYYREEESLKKILEYLAPEFLGQIDLSNLEDRYALFRILVIVGEYATKKNLAATTRETSHVIDWDLLAGLRNRLVHHEWYLAHKDVFAGLIAEDVSQILAIDLPLIRQEMLAIWNNHQRVREEGQSHERLFDRKVSDYFKQVETEALLSEEERGILNENCRWLLENGFITAEQFQNIVAMLGQDLRNIEMMKFLIECIDRDKLERPLLGSEELQQTKKLVQDFNEIKGALFRKLNEKTKGKVYVFLKQLLQCKVIDEERAAEIKKEIKETESLDGLLTLFDEIKLELLTGERLEILIRFRQIQEASANKKSNHIKKLYEFLNSEDLLAETRRTEIDDILKQELTKKETSEQIDTVKLQVIEKFLKDNGMEDINPEIVELSNDYLSLVGYICPPVKDGLSDKINDLLEYLIAQGFLTVDVAEGLNDLLKNHQIDSFLAELKKAIGEEKFTPQYQDQFKDDEVVALEEMRRKFGSILDTINKAKENFRRELDNIERRIQAEKDNNLHNLRRLKENLPDDKSHKEKLGENGDPKQTTYDQQDVVERALDMINRLEELLDAERFEGLAAVQKGFPEERQFLKMPFDVWERVRDARYMEHEGYMAALEKLQHYSGTSMVRIPLRERVIQNEDDIITGREIPINLFEVEAAAYINGNIDYIIEATINYSYLVDTCETLRDNPLLRLAVEYIMSVIWPYLSEMQQEYLVWLPKMMQAELKTQRNFAQHGNVYVDLIVGEEMEEFTARYTSIFIKDLKPMLEKLHASFSDYTIKEYEALQDLWYGDEHITGLLRHYLTGDDYTVIAPTVFDNSDLLRSNTIAAINAAYSGQVAGMPINLHGNHWVVAVMHAQDGVLQVIFNNPFGASIELEPNAIAFVQMLQTATFAFNRSAPNIIDLRLPQQQNGDDCGPFTVDNLVRLAELAREHPINILEFTREQIIEGAGLQTPQDGSASDIREEHNLIFADLGLPIPGGNAAPNVNGGVDSPESLEANNTHQIVPAIDMLNSTEAENMLGLADPANLLLLLPLMGKLGGSAEL